MNEPLQMPSGSIVEGLTQLLRPLEAADTLLLVGSIAEGLSNDGSDVDLCILTQRVDAHEQRESAELADISAWGKELRLDVRVYSQSTLRDIGDRLQKQVVSLCSGRAHAQPASVTEYEAHLLHRVRTGVALANRSVAARLREELVVDNLIPFLVVQSLQKFFQYRRDVAGQLKGRDEVTARWMLAHAADAIACAELASVGVTHVRSKWRTKLVMKHRDAIGPEHADALLRLLVPSTAWVIQDLLSELTMYLYSAVARIVERRPDIGDACVRARENPIDEQFIDQ